MFNFNAFGPPPGGTLPGFTPPIAPTIPTEVRPLPPSGGAGGGFVDGLLRGLGFPFNVLPDVNSVAGANGGNLLIQAEEFAYTFATYIAVNSATILLFGVGLYLLFAPEIQQAIVTIKGAAKDAAEVGAAAVAA